MLKSFLRSAVLALAALSVGISSAQTFVPGQVLTANQLNNAFTSATANAVTAQQTALSASTGAGTIGTTGGTTLQSNLTNGVCTRIANLAALRAVNHLASTAACTDGYTTANDGGKGDYLMVSTTSGGYTDDACATIIASDGAVWKLKVGQAIYLPQCGADRTGVADSSTPFQAAINTGLPVYLGGSGNTFKIVTGATYTGTVTLYGDGATISTNVIFLTVTNGSNSKVYNFNVLPATTPYTILRNTTSWAAPTVLQQLNGYMPTSQDIDIWSSFSGTGGQTTNTTIKPAILFTVNSSSGANYLDIHGLTGYQLTLIVEGYNNIQIHDNNFGAGGLSYGGIVVMGGMTRHYNSSFFGFTTPRGSNNQIANNQVRYASLSGIVLFGQDDFQITGNTASFNGESGIKTYQYDGVAGPSETSAVINTTGRIVGNKSSDNYYDGIDAAIYNGVTQVYAYIGTVISGNIGERNHQTGSITNGYDMVYAGNHFSSNGTHGLAVTGGINTVTGNYARDNMTTGTTQVAQPFDIVVEGDDMAVTGNSVYNTTAYPTFNLFHTGALGAAPTSGHEGVDAGNYSSRGTASINISPSIPSSKTAALVQGPLQTNSYLQTSAVTTVTATAYTVLSTDSALSFYTTAATTVTLPAASSYPGRELVLRNTNSYAITSASANVGPVVGGAPGTAILAATVGKWCLLKSDGSYWQIMAAN